MFSISYLLQASCCTALFWLVYHFLLSQTTFFKLNRIYLLSSLFLSLAIPLIEFQSVYTPVQLISQQLPEFVSGTVNGEMNQDSSYNYFYLIYLLGCTIFLGLFITELLRVRFLMTNHKKEQEGTSFLYHVEGIDQIFSFGKSIFIPMGWSISETEKNTIIQHEKAHIQQYHTLDILLINGIKIFFWFNPFVFLFEYSLKENHEFLADETTLRTNEKYAYAQSILACVQTSDKFKLPHTFSNKSQLKQRIMMISKQKTDSFQLSRYLSFAIVTIFLLGIFSCTDETIDGVEQNDKTMVEAENAETVFQLVEEMPEFPGGVEAMLNYLGTNIKYPQISKDAGIEGRNVAKFIVEKDGSISNVSIVKSLDEATDEETLRVVNSMPKWTSGKQEGKDVRVAFNLPVRYKLE